MSEAVTIFGSTLAIGAIVLVILASPILWWTGRVKSRRSLAKWLFIAAGFGGAGLALAGLFFAFAGLSEEPRFAHLVNASGEDLVIERPAAWLEDADVSYQRIRDGAQTTIPSTRVDGSHCLRADAGRLLLLADGVEFRPVPNYQYGRSQFEIFDESEYTAVVSIPRDGCYEGYEVWIEWDGDEFSQISEPGLPPHGWVLVVTAAVVALCLGSGWRADRRERTPVVPVAMGQTESLWSTGVPTQPPPPR